MLLSADKHTVCMNIPVAATLAALAAVSVWRTMPNPPKVYIGGNRIHHGLAGALMFGLGVLTKRRDAAAAGLVLALDDIEDFQQWLDFAEQNHRHADIV